MISVIIITKNEEEHIKDCLESISWADEIIIIDSNSDDKTIDIAKTFTDKITITSDWPGYGPQKNRALDLATGDWVLSIDADERVSAELKAEILQAIKADTLPAYRIPRQSSYCGRWIKHSGWSPDYVIRLFKREQAKFSDDLVHERIIVNENKMGTLKFPFLHYTYESLEEVLEKNNQYSSAGAQQRFEKTAKGSSLKTAIAHGFWAFIRTYIIRAGFLDGREGFILAVSNAEVTYYRYLKLMYLQEKITRPANRPSH